ncbi:MULTISPECIES: hypothetical protein [unclassified Mycoplasma]|uniref:hypothetical protein n=1 Tax=unclassified Mycoplasma TaxID=2683645 RepID=UPI0013753388
MKKFTKTLLVIATSTAVFPIVAGLVYYDQFYQKTVDPVSPGISKIANQEDKEKKV